MSDEIRVTTGNFKYAGFWIRLLALLIDSLIVSLLMLLFFGSQIGVLYSGDPELIMVAMSTTTPLLAIVPIVYYILFWTLLSTTPGKMILKLKIVNYEGNKISFGQSVLRYIGYMLSAIVLYIGFIWAAFDTKRQGWHDKIAKTYVVRK
ncbi:RDD family protein [Candidatus Peregrinibacteria bacterium]|nr:RDD family protein [Candidatus Peregrinibacteria bacterium]